MIYSAEELRKGIMECNRVALSKALTLVESYLPEHRQEAEVLLNSLSTLIQQRSAIRVAITGIPGAGKSTLIEALGMLEISEGKKVAVLAIDPSSPESKGSILGDKTRMNTLASHPSSFIRPSPSGSFRGGIHRSTYESMLLFQAAGFDYIFIETVGVGQNEWLVKYLCDVLLLITVGGTGDELQGIKRGIMETADIIVVNKADGPQQELATQAIRDLRKSVSLLPERYTGWTPPVIPCSAIEKKGLEEIRKQWQKFLRHLSDSGISIEQRRKSNRKYFFRFLLGDLLSEELEKTGITEYWLENSPVAFPIYTVQHKIRNMIGK